jgi:demethylmenaquinone methyltransferase/2-methoxy-6-polyprenyl-1,4-benzoquinol methylase
MSQISQLDKSAPRVRAMFSSIAGRYDLLNHLLSANQDKAWRRKAIRLLQPQADEKILDLCCGTGDFAAQCLSTQPACRLTGADFAIPMLQLAKEKNSKSIPFLAADALQLPFPDHHFDAVMVAFGVRNFTDTKAGLQEIARVLRPGGRFLMLEFLRPQSTFLKWGFGIFFRWILPVIGKLISGHNEAYSYLPTSVNEFFSEKEIVPLLESCGLKVRICKNHSAGIATSVLCEKL